MALVSFSKQKNQKGAVTLFLDKALHRTLKVYATETDQTMREVLKEPLERLEQDILKIITQIEEMRHTAELKRIKAQDEAKIVAENPMPVSGHEENPIGDKIESEQAC